MYICTCIYMYMYRERDTNLTYRPFMQGTLVANDWNKQRIAALASNLARG